MKSYLPTPRVALTAVGILAGLGIVGGIAGGIVISLGGMNVSARPQHNALVTEMLHYTFKRSVAARSGDIAVPEDLHTEGRVKLGAQHYANVCSKCHGGPGLGQNPVALSMRPRPQHLPSVVDQFDDDELYYILWNGVKFSAMPSWPTDERDDAGIWATVAFLRAMPEMSAEQYSEMVAPTRQQIEDTPVLPYGEIGELAEVSMEPKAPPLDEYLYASPATGWPDLGMDGLPVTRCAACHGTDGAGDATNGEAPNLTTLEPDYIAHTLQEYATGKKPSAIMQTVAANLSNSQIDRLATYYDLLPDVGSGATLSQDASVEAGRVIALNGKEGAVPSCLTCHDGGETEGSIFVPHLAGQSPVYIKRKLDAYAVAESDGQIGYHPMPFVASNLDAVDRTNLAAYFGSLEPGEEPARPEREVDLANAENLVETVCVECHEEGGLGTNSGEFPNLTVHTPAYIEQQLWAFRAQERMNDRMFQTATRLEAQDIADLAAYFGNRPAQDSRMPEGYDPQSEGVSRGAEIAQNGVPDAGVPACLSCHGEATTADMPIFARLHGQNPVYLEHRLETFAQTENDELYALNPMGEISKALSQEQRADVAAWFAAQDALSKTAAD
ncbi:Cytochrome c553 [Tranquillimonas rosea]|uniref:Cytochrome c553 n=1 Tax=Tranquillimonas rosea TaxID=641238 RepID=A0A1H9X7K0_9RHOB|nr:c-type cytochrome [Tranquillimonas rosea]SES41847.1 Cytochrome c553 [Tranquillimonas rosea]